MSENNNNNGSSDQPQFPPGNANFTRLDNRTKMSLMASIMFGLDGTISVREAVDYALEIDSMVGDKLRQLKDEKRRIMEKKNHPRS